jgi:two-component system OmpR family response regulator
MRALLVEDYDPLRRSLEKGIREAGYAVDAAADGEEGLWYGRNNPYDIIVLDLMLPKLDGLEVLRQLRLSGSRSPVLILTARDAVADRVQGLDGGADDYLTKPFAVEELLARMRALVRRRYDTHQTVLTVGALELDTAAKRVFRHGEEIELTAREYGLLEYLARRAGQTVSRTEIWDHLYEFDSSATSNVVDVYIGYLRRKLDNPEAESCIRTIRGQGYRMEA